MCHGGGNRAWRNREKPRLFMLSAPRSAGGSEIAADAAAGN